MQSQWFIPRSIHIVGFFSLFCFLVFVVFSICSYTANAFTGCCTSSFLGLFKVSELLHLLIILQGGTIKLSP